MGMVKKRKGKKKKRKETILRHQFALHLLRFQ